MTQRTPMTLAVLVLALLSVGAAPPPAAPSDSLRFGVHLVDASPLTLQLARDGKFDTVVQLFSWRQIEPTKGQYHWQYPDEVAAGAAYYGLDLVVRLDQQPAWANRAPADGNSPPDDPADFGRFARMVASRYRGRVLAYVIWNEPNLAVDWGGRTPDPAAYTALLRAAYAAVKEADPDALVVSAGLASTNDRGDGAFDDRAYLEGMYQAGAGRYFDVLGAHPYGFAYPPDDPRGAHAGLNMARLVDLRDIMLRHGDAGKPVWATEMGWTTGAAGAAAWQTVTPDQQASYLARAFAYAPQAWPWLGLLAVWNLGGEAEPGYAGYSLLAPDGTPRPAYTSLRDVPRPPRARSTDLWGFGLFKWLAEWTLVRTTHFTVLATDSVIHLGDSQYSEPWMPLYANRNPSVDWEGTFYLPDWTLTRLVTARAMSDGACETVEAGCWWLDLRVMQSNAWGDTVWINGAPLEPPLPGGDFTNSWMSVRLPVPARVLHPGPNQIRLTIARAVPLLQDRGFAWDDLQIKDIVLRPG